jgi:hypothetical protein
LTPLASMTNSDAGDMVCAVVAGVALLISGGETYPNLAGSAQLGNTGFEHITRSQKHYRLTQVYAADAPAGESPAFTLETQIDVHPQLRLQPNQQLEGDVFEGR